MGYFGRYFLLIEQAAMFAALAGMAGPAAAPVINRLRLNKPQNILVGRIIRNNHTKDTASLLEQKQQDLRRSLER